MSKVLVLVSCLALSLAAAAQTVVATIPVGNNPDEVAVDRTTNLIYAVNVGDSTVSVVNGANGKVVATIGVGSFPQAVAVNPTLDLIYVGNFGSADQLSVINGQTGKVFNVQLSSSGVATGLTANYKTGSVYACNGNDVVVVEGKTNKVIATVPVSQCGFGLNVNPRTDLIYAATFTPNITVIDGSTNQVVDTLPLNLTGAVTVAVDAKTNRLGVVDGNAGEFEVVDAASGDVLGTVSGLQRPFGAVYRPGAKMAFVAEQSGNDVAVLDTASFTIKTRVTVGTNPLGLDYNPNTHLIYVANYLSNTVSVISVP